MNPLFSRLKNLEMKIVSRYNFGMAFVDRNDDGLYEANASIDNTSNMKGKNIKFTASTEEELIYKIREWFKLHIDPKNGQSIIFSGEYDLED